MALESVMKGTGRVRPFTVRVSVDNETFTNNAQAAKFCFWQNLLSRVLFPTIFLLKLIVTEEERVVNLFDIL